MQVSWRRLAGARLVAGRHPASRHRVRVDYEEHALAGRFDERREGGSHRIRRSTCRTGGQFSADGLGVYVTTDKDSEFQRLGYIDLATKQLTPLADRPQWDVEGFELSHDGKTIASVGQRSGHFQAAPVRHRCAQAADGAGVPNGVIGPLWWHRNNREVAFSIASARSTSDVYSLDATTGAVTRWTESELGGLVASDLSEPELIRWKSFDGLEISGFYYKAPARFTGKRPVIINIHGGPEGQSRPWFIGRNNYFLNELGVSIIYPNVRGSVGFGKTFVGLDNGMKREDSVKDIGALLDWIATRPELDATRVMVTGGSYGGYMTLAVVDDVQQPPARRRRRRRHLELQHVSEEHRELSPRSAPRRVRRRARPEDGGLLRQDRAD